MTASRPARRRLGPAACVLAGLALGLGGLRVAAADADPAPTATPPVIVPAEPWNSLPLAQMSGTLTLENGCLLLAGQVVFWPHGTGWDADAQAVIHPDAPPSAVGEWFAGGGGEYASSIDFAWLGEDIEQAIEECVRRTGAPRVVLAYPP